MADVYVIAECCNNFQNSVEIAKRMIDVAAECGVDAVKFQHRRRISLFDVSALYAHAEQAHVDFLCTAYDVEGVDEINPLVKAHKVGSAEVTDAAFLAHVASKGKPVICSTGACTPAQVLSARAALAAAPRVTLLQCTSVYPTPLTLTRLGVIPEWHNSYLNTGIGYSDHTGTVAAPVAAMTLGASVVEVHFTLSKALPGPDQACSHEAHQLKEICDFAHQRERILRGRKECFDAEMEKISLFRKVP